MPKTKKLDCTGWPVPPALLPHWDRIHEVDEMLEMISHIRLFLERMERDHDKMYLDVDIPYTLSFLQRAATQLRCAKPYAVCYICQGHPETQPDSQCRFCRGKGWVSKWRYDLLVPDEVKEIRKKGAKK